LGYLTHFNGNVLALETPQDELGDDERNLAALKSFIRVEACG